MPYQTQFDIIERRARLSSIEPPRDLILGKKKKKIVGARQIIFFILFELCHELYIQRLSTHERPSLS